MLIQLRPSAIECGRMGSPRGRGRKPFERRALDGHPGKEPGLVILAGSGRAGRRNDAGGRENGQQKSAEQGHRVADNFRTSPGTEARPKENIVIFLHPSSAVIGPIGPIRPIGPTPPSPPGNTPPHFPPARRAPHPPAPRSPARGSSSPL